VAGAGPDWILRDGGKGLWATWAIPTLLCLEQGTQYSEPQFLLLKSSSIQVKYPLPKIFVTRSVSQLEFFRFGNVCI
jgi:hypothetical protein